jgi:hypothetical protein
LKGKVDRNTEQTIYKHKWWGGGGGRTGKKEGG